MARRSMAMHEQYSTHLVMFFAVFFCTPLERELWGNDWFLYENSTGEKGHLILSAVRFFCFVYWLACSKFTLLSTLWAKEDKSILTTTFA